MNKIERWDTRAKFTLILLGCYKPDCVDYRLHNQVLHQLLSTRSLGFHFPIPPNIISHIGQLMESSISIKTSIRRVYDISYLSHLFIDSFLRKFRWKNYKIKTSFDSPEWPKYWANKTGINLMIFYFTIRRKLSTIR